MKNCECIRIWFLMLGSWSFRCHFWNNWKRYIYVENNLDRVVQWPLSLYPNSVTCVAIRKFPFELILFFLFFFFSGKISWRFWKDKGKGLHSCHGRPCDRASEEEHPGRERRRLQRGPSAHRGDGQETWDHCRWAGRRASWQGCTVEKMVFALALELPSLVIGLLFQSLIWCLTENGPQAKCYLLYRVGGDPRRSPDIVANPFCCWVFSVFHNFLVLRMFLLVKQRSTQISDMNANKGWTTILFFFL